MAGRPLRRLRAEAFEALTVDETAALARDLVAQRLNDSQLLALLLSSGRSGNLAVQMTMREIRNAVAELVAADPTAAKNAVALYPQVLDPRIADLAHTRARNTQARTTKRTRRERAFGRHNVR